MRILPSNTLNFVFLPFSRMSREYCYCQLYQPAHTPTTLLYHPVYHSLRSKHRWSQMWMLNYITPHSAEHSQKCHLVWRECNCPCAPLLSSPLFSFFFSRLPSATPLYLCTTRPISYGTLLLIVNNCLDLTSDTTPKLRTNLTTSHPKLFVSR